MSVEVKALMENKPIHWTQQGLCRGDDRFTGRLEWLAMSELVEMDAKCGVCPVFSECNNWANDPLVTDVFAAGYWRWPKDG